MTEKPVIRTERKAVTCPICKGRKTFPGQDGVMLVCYTCDANGQILQDVAIDKPQLPGRD
jgi:hypothetical protein